MSALLLAVLAYPFLLNPDWLQGSKPRMAGPGTVPLVVVPGWLLADPVVARPRRAWQAFA